ncbi:MAG: hypothetical protein ACE5F6_21160 [Anaerolineae bacterium]
MEMEELLLARLQHDYSDAGFEAIFVRLDLLHDLVSAGRMSAATELPPDQVRGWLEEIIFTAREIIHEMDRGGDDHDTG